MVLDPLNNVVTLLSNNWNSSNTNDRTPVIDKIFNHKRIDLANDDYVLVYSLTRRTKPNGIGSATKESEDVIIIDVRTVLTESHFRAMWDELVRILDNNIIDPDATYDILKPDGEEKDLSDKSHNLWRMTKEIVLWRTNISR